MVDARCVRGQRWPLWAVWHGPRLSGALPPGRGSRQPPRTRWERGRRWRRELGNPGPALSACGWRLLLDSSVFFLSFFRSPHHPPPFVEDTDVFMFADHLLRAPSVQLLKLSLHVTRLSRCEASSNPWRV